MQLTPKLLISTQPDDHRAVMVRYIHTHWPDLKSEHISWFPEEDDENISMETVRQLQTQLHYTALGTLRVIVGLHLDKASLPAQQALLKTLEEPPENTQLLFTCRQLTVLPPTILSRCQLEYLTADQKLDLNQAQELYQQLTTGDIPTILSLAASYPKKEAALRCLEMLLSYLHQENHHQPQANYVHQLTQLLTAYEHIWQNHNPRLVLEHTWLSWRSDSP